MKQDNPAFVQLGNTLLLIRTQVDNALQALEDLKPSLLEGESKTPPPAPLTPTVYAQRHPKWAADPLGRSTKWTIGTSGCLISSYASCLTDAGKPMNPREINDWLKANNGYMADAEGQIVNFIFSRPDRLGVLKFEALAKYNGPAPMDKIEQYIRDGGYIVIMVKRPGVPQHWVRYLGNGKIADPWFAEINELLAHYTGKNVAEAIWAAAYYKRAQAVG